MHVVIFEGQLWERFIPISLSRPVFGLATGMSTLLGKQIRHLNPSRLSLWVRPEFEAFCRDRVAPRLGVPVAINAPLNEEPALLCSGRTLHLQPYEFPSEPAVVLDQEQYVRTAYVVSPGLGPGDVLARTDRWLRLLELPQVMSQTRMVESLWDLISWNEESLIEDFTQLRGRAASIPAGPYHLINEQEIWLGENAALQPGVVLDAGKGPIVLDRNVYVGANSVIEGPCYVGPHVRISPLCYIRPGTSVGTMSKVGGEISNSLILGYCNKIHHGYIGDSYIGKWTNIGAGTTASNLKNTYGEVLMHLGDRKIPTGRRFLGTLMGDHSKTAVNSTLMAGTYIGFSSMVASSGYAPGFVPSFNFCTPKGSEPYVLDKAIEVAQRVFARRDRAWTDADTRIMRYAATAAPAVER